MPEREIASKEVLDQFEGVIRRCLRGDIPLEEKIFRIKQITDTLLCDQDRVARVLFLGLLDQLESSVAHMTKDDAITHKGSDFIKQFIKGARVLVEETAHASLVSPEERNIYKNTFANI